MAGMELPKQYDPKIAEQKWQGFWEKEHIYSFDADDTSRELFTIDTPPPTVSGSMHLGHAFSYSQNDFIARFQRMRGRNVFYPFGTDDNGLATERLVEKLNKVRSTGMKRSEFIRLCLDTLDRIRPDFVQDWKNIGMSCDFGLIYSTINDHCRKISQRSFIDLYRKGREYRKEAPSIWCPDCQTAIAQVELEDKELDSLFSDLKFRIDDDESIVISTTRPEMLGSCVAVFVHPDDARHSRLVGMMAQVPIFGQQVRILADPRADPQKGTGAVMCCTFGDQTDIEWYKAHSLPLRISISPDGRLNNLGGKYSGLKVTEARKQIIQDLTQQGYLLASRPIKHTVNVHERCGTPIEILNTKQWFVSYLDLKEQFLKNGHQMGWYPEHMRIRLDNWITGLQWDWCISRQRHFGVPFPVWYCEKCGEVILADETCLPIDPTEQAPPVDTCTKCGHRGFIPEKDVLDTWATSSLTPELAGELIKGTPNHNKLYPMDLRPQAHDIITFWLFNTLVKSQLHHQRNPWKNIMISGWALDPHGKKMSKSKGNVIAPQVMIEKYSADALRFWAAGSKLGDDMPFQEKDLITGKKLVTKLWNASKFVIMNLEGYDYRRSDLEVMDRWMLTKLQKLIKSATESFERFEYSKAKSEIELFFWQVFCDNYIEIVKERIYNLTDHHPGARDSALFGLYEGNLNGLKLLAPFIPFITEEVYQLHYARKEGLKSIHLSSWPQYNEKLVDEEAEKSGDLAVALISALRKMKSEKQLSLKAEIARLVIGCDDVTRKLLEPVLSDVMATSIVRDIEFGDGEIPIGSGLRISVEFS